jgi:hypothetical protein
LTDNASSERILHRERAEIEPQMQIKANYGWDTGAYLVDVYLESDHERNLSTGALWEEVISRLDAEGISLDAVVDCFVYREDAEGNWVSGGILPWSNE